MTSKGKFPLITTDYEVGVKQLIDEIAFRGRGQSSSIYRQRIYYVGALALPPSPTNVTKEE